VDLQDQSPLEIANQMATKVKKHARPWRAIIALVLAIASAAVAGATGVGVRNVFKTGHHAPPVASRIVWASATAAFCFFAVIAIVGLAGKARDVLSPRTGTGHAAVVRYAILLTGAVIMALSLLALLKIPVTQLLVGGAVTTIFIGIAAQQSLGNVFAGLVLLMSRPFMVGDTIVLRSGSLGGQLTGTVTEIGLTYLRLETDDGVLSLPNSQVLASGVGHIRSAIPEPGGTVPAGGGGAASGADSPGSGAPGAGAAGAAAAGAGAADGAAADGGADGADGGAGGSGADGNAAGRRREVTTDASSGRGNTHGDGPGTANAAGPASAATSPPSGGPPAGDPPGSGGRPLAPPGL
jgi:Mechanosensitive ion channel, beta-domain